MSSLRLIVIRKQAITPTSRRLTTPAIKRPRTSASFDSNPVSSRRPFDRAIWPDFGAFRRHSFPLLREASQTGLSRSGSTATLASSAPTNHPKGLNGRDYLIHRLLDHIGRSSQPQMGRLSRACLVMLGAMKMGPTVRQASEKPGKTLPNLDFAPADSAIGH